MLDEGETVESPRVREAAGPLVAVAYHSACARDRESVKRRPNGEAWLASVEALPERVRHLSVHRGHAKEISNGHDKLADLSIAKRVSFTGTADELRDRLDGLEKTQLIFTVFDCCGSLSDWLSDVRTPPPVARDQSKVALHHFSFW